MTVKGKYNSDEYQTFEEWFECTDYLVDDKVVAIQAWNAAIDISSQYFFDHEGTDFDLLETLTADTKGLNIPNVRA